MKTYEEQMKRLIDAYECLQPDDIEFKDIDEKKAMMIVYDLIYLIEEIEKDEI